MADTFFQTVLPRLKAVDNGDGTYSIAISVEDMSGALDDTPVNGELEQGITSNWAYDHSVDLDAHTRSPWETMRTGVYILPVPARGAAAVAMVANTLYAMPFSVPRALSVDRIACHVTAQAGQKIRMGIYEDGVNLYPGDLVVDAGEIVLAGVGITASIIAEALDKELYWMAFISDGTPTLVTIDMLYYSPLGLWAGNFTGVSRGWDVAQAYGALPDPFTGGGALELTKMPLVAPRLLTLD